MNGVRRWRAVAVIAGAVVVAAAAADPAGAAMTGNTFGGTGGVRPGGHAGQVTVVLGCEPEGVFAVEVNVTQGDTVAVGRRRGHCTGGAESYAVRVVTRSGTRLGSGHAEICGEASTREAGDIGRTHSRCGASGVDLRER